MTDVYVDNYTDPRLVSAEEAAQVVRDAVAALRPCCSRAHTGCCGHDYGSDDEPELTDDEKLAALLMAQVNFGHPTWLKSGYVIIESPNLCDGPVPF